jgi:DNA replication protein DnaC
MEHIDRSLETLNERFLGRNIQSIIPSQVNGETQLNRYNIVSRELDKLGVPKRYHGSSFDSFSCNGDNYKYMLDQVVKFSLSPKKDLFLYGGVGSGKTHLSVSILRKFYDDKFYHGSDGIFRPLISFVSASDILLHFKASYGGQESEESLLHKYTSPDFLIIDGLEAEYQNDWSRFRFYMIIERRYSNMKRTVITSNMTMEICEKEFGSPFASRVGSGYVVLNQLPDYRRNAN